MKIKNCFYFRRAAAAIALFFAIPMLTAAGQFDALHQGIAQNTDTLIGNWQQFFPGLEGQINAAFEEGRKTGNFIFHSNAAPVAWNVSENGTIAINSINPGYFRSIRDPEITNFSFQAFPLKVKMLISQLGATLLLPLFPYQKKDSAMR